MIAADASAMRRTGRTAPCPARGAAVALLVLTLACACAREAAEPSAAPVTPRATVVLEPPVLEIGDTAVVEIAVVTPPDHEVPALEAPESVPGLWLLGAEMPRIERGPSRWVHRARFRVRAHETGRFAWPETDVPVVGPDGEQATLRAEARPFEVVSLLEERAQGFLSYREPDLPAGGGSPGVAVLAGALAALAGVGLVWLVRRVRSAGAAAGGARAVGAAVDGPSWSGVQQELERAAARAHREPVEAAQRTAAVLRDLASRRLGGGVLTRTTEELALRPPPATLEEPWHELLALLGALDAVRFAPADRAGERVVGLVDRARALTGPLRPRGLAP